MTYNEYITDTMAFVAKGMFAMSHPIPTVDPEDIDPDMPEVDEEFEPNVGTPAEEVLKELDEMDDDSAETERDIDAENFERQREDAMNL